MSSEKDVNSMFAELEDAEDQVITPSAQSATSHEVECSQANKLDAQEADGLEENDVSLTEDEGFASSCQTDIARRVRQRNDRKRKLVATPFTTGDRKNKKEKLSPKKKKIEPIPTHAPAPRIWMWAADLSSTKTSIPGHWLPIPHPSPHSIRLSTAPEQFQSLPLNNWDGQYHRFPNVITQYLGPIRKADQLKGAASKMSSGSSEWRLRNTFPGKNHSVGSDNNISSTKMKQIYVAKSLSTADAPSS
ncbi:hypothetical protein KFK09_025402 [Dendrobium nobile]|uniref:Uncharacterized protein n=1 Tax=Dendrobium nobile TaxID=94219 RepID=A0A8T3AHM3_DENNO|nr:hypothetical protein KFK09_025402 [Dendrobium nobile]